jgi:hypothetical protein
VVASIAYLAGQRRQGKLRKLKAILKVVLLVAGAAGDDDVAANVAEVASARRLPS